MSMDANSISVVPASTSVSLKEKWWHIMDTWKISVIPLPLFLLAGVLAFNLGNLIVIISRVSTLVATGFFVGKKIGMYPIDVAIISCGQGGTGDVAILIAGNRMCLMPFAQIATRIGGAINVFLSLLVPATLSFTYCFPG